jgi:hypothetical protein
MKDSIMRSERPFKRMHFNGLVNQPANLVAAERGDDPLDLTPVAEAGDIALVAAALRASSSFVSGIVTEAVHQLRRIGESQTSVDEHSLHGAPLTARLFRLCR